MKRLKYQVAIIVALVVFLIGCSETVITQPDVGMTPQFGTAYDDKPVNVAVNKQGAIFGLYNYVDPSDGCDYYSEYEEYSDCYDYSDIAMLTRYNSSGGVVFQQEVFRRGCYYDYYYGYCNRYTAESVYTDSNNYAYVLVSSEYLDYYGDSTSYTIFKYAPLGEHVTTIDVGSFDGDKTNFTVKTNVDASGNIYVASQDRANGNNNLTKYNSSGSRIWYKSTSITPGYGTPSDLAISSAGTLYVVGSKGISSYSSSGKLNWSRAAGQLVNVTMSGSNIYTRYRQDIRKFDAAGKQLWLKTQSGLSSMILQDIAGDASGNVYLSGKYAASSTNWNPLARKLNSSGTVLWTKTYGTSAYDDALSIATISGTDIYMLGESQGSMAHTHRGMRDGYLRKTNSTGATIWAR